MQYQEDIEFMRMAIDLSFEGMRKDQGGPFGAIVVKNGKIIGKGNNQVIFANDPTAHAEVVAIRDACKNLGDFQLKDCTLYTSCEPCPMCMGAIYWARPAKVFYACTHKDASKYGFDDSMIYQEMTVPIAERKIETTNILREEALKAFEEWDRKENKKLY